VPAPTDPEAALVETEAYWQEWAGRCQYTGEWSDAVLRSHIILKALTYRPTGGIVASVSTSLPERVGGSRNWDYRYCWLRDATFTLLSLMNAGYQEEALAWRDWLLRAVAGSPWQMQAVYGLAGEKRLAEWEVPWLPGYEGSQPVRIGNAAFGQLQFDVYGEIMDAMFQAHSKGMGTRQADWRLQRALVEHLAKIWREPDEGIWEVRGGRQQFTHSKVMAWVALDRTIKTAKQASLRAPIARWCELRQTIHDDICHNGFDPELGSFVQAYGSKRLDASLLLMPLVGFLPAADARVRGTVEAIRQHLTSDGFVLRYDTDATEDGLPPGEGLFLACSFWLADNLVLLGQWKEARELFERLLALRNDVGLLAEEYDPRTGRQLGNFPQAFTHVALANTAHNLTKAVKPAEQRAISGVEESSQAHEN
jgi:GH15 family glucan-1,4-alpha-glucosidase